MKIGELAGRSGLNASAIRYYERRGLLPAAHRAGGQRRYPAHALHRVVLIRFASEMGFTLSEIKVFLNGLQDDAPVGPRWKRLAHRKILEGMRQSNAYPRSRPKHPPLAPPEIAPGTLS